MSDSRFRPPGSLLRFVCAVSCLLLAVTGCSHPLPNYVSSYTTPPPEPPTIAVAIIGNPYISGASTGTHAWPALVTAQLRRQNINAELQTAGSAAGGKDNETLARQVQQIVRPTTKLAVIFGHAGELGGAAAAVMSAITEVKKTAPEAKFLVIGPAWTNGQPPKSIRAMNGALRAEAQATRAMFVDPIADGWFAGQPDLIGPDNVTLTDAGHAYLAGKMAPLIAQQLQPVLTGPVATPR